MIYRTYYEQNSFYRIYQIMKISNYLFLLLLLLVSCAPQTKESYLKNYENFIKEVKQNHEHYTAEDWKEADKKFTKFTGEYRQKFQGEFTLSESALLFTLDSEYQIYKFKQPVVDIIKTFNTDDHDKLEKLINKYVDEGSKENLKKLIEHANQAGGEFQKAVNQILKEMNIDSDDL